MTCLLDDSLDIASVKKLSTGHYDLGYRFDLSQSIRISIESTETIRSEAFARAALDIQSALPDVRFVFDDKGTFEGPFNHKVIFAEVHSDQPWYGVALAAHDSPAGFKPCYGTDWGLEFESLDLVDTKGIQGGLTGQKIANCGLVMFNTKALIRDFGERVAAGYLIYLVAHEFTHLLGLGHAPGTLMQPYIQNGQPVNWRYTSSDIGALKKLAYRTA